MKVLSVVCGAMAEMDIIGVEVKDASNIRLYDGD